MQYRRPQSWKWEMSRFPKSTAARQEKHHSTKKRKPDIWKCSESKSKGRKRGPSMWGSGGDQYYRIKFSLPKKNKKKKEKKRKDEVEKKFLQLNANRSKAAHDVTAKIAVEQRGNFLLFTEPNKKEVKKGGWYVDPRADTAIKVLDPIKDAVLDWGARDGITWIEICQVRIIVGYISPNINISEFMIQIDKIESTIRESKIPVILAGDFNAKSKLWGGKIEDKRGEELAALLARCGLETINKGEQPTFVGGRGHSHVDVTCASGKIEGKISKWKVHSEEEIMSDHQLITFSMDEVVGAQQSRLQKGRESHKGWRWSPRYAEEMEEVGARHLKNLREHTVEEVTRRIADACDEVLPRKKATCKKRPVYWWTDEVSEARKAAILAKRKLARIRAKNKIPQNMAEWERHVEEKKALHREARKNFRMSIFRAKEAAWDILIQQVKDDPWGQGYKVVMNKLNRSTPPTAKEYEEELKNLFPAAPEVTWPQRTWGDIEPFTKTELEEAANRLKPNKAPGPDGIPAEVVKVITKSTPQVLLNLFDKEFAEAKFPAPWKTARLVLIPKAEGEQGGRRKFRPICLINTLAKCFEHLIRNRINKELEETGGLEDNQHGFRAGHSTVNAIEKVISFANMANEGTWGRKDLCAMVTLDVRNAFNSAPWTKIVAAMERKGMKQHTIAVVQQYLTDRYLETKQGKMKISCGVPQGSVLGPLLWNILYDDALRIDMPVGVQRVAFADDLTTTTMARQETELAKITNEALERVQKWMEETGLELAEHKTEAVLLIGKRRSKEVRFQLRGQAIVPQKTIKYLGIYLDTAISFTPHIEIATIKAEKMAAAIGRLTPRRYQIGYKSAKMYAAVYHSKLLYGVEIWGKKALSGGKNVEILRKAHRRVLLRLTGAYRTVSTEALQVVAAILPIDLQICDRINRYKHRETGRPDESRNQMKAWHERWESTGNGRWTYRIIPDMEKWVGRSFGNLTFHLTQGLTGHGCFNKYLHSIGKQEAPKCWHCLQGEEDDAEHTLFRCERWDAARVNYMKETNEWPEVDNLVETMMRTEENWNSGLRMITNIMKAKEKEERAREQASKGHGAS